LLNFISTASYIFSLRRLKALSLNSLIELLIFLVGGNQASPRVPVAKFKKWLSACCLPRSGKHIFSVFLVIYWFMLFSIFVKQYLWFSNDYVLLGFVRALIVLIFNFLYVNRYPFGPSVQSIFMSWWHNRLHIFSIKLITFI
jgi:hypothetical protein